MLKIASGFQLPPTVDLSVLDHLPVHVHKYGDPQPNKATFRWMTYVDEGAYKGSIGFARNVSTFMPEVAAYTVGFLSGIADIEFDPARVNFMRTIGDVTPHTDEGGRLCCVNIGICGSSNAATRVSIDNNYKTFEKAHTEHVAEDGCAYLLDVSRIHAVRALNSEPRLLISYGFAVPYEKVLSRIRAL